jgi:phosphoribosyl 1,2-cyclic phosphodiesterase
VLRVRSLASGSSGNSLVVQVGRRAVLFDAGGPQRRLAAGLDELGVAPGQLAAIFLTHEHTDHVASAAALSRLYDAPIVANAATLLAAGFTADRGQVLATGRTLDLRDLEVTSFGVAHDSAEPVGYVARGEGWTVAVATDLGHVSPAVLEQVRGADLLVLESNHDVEMLRHGPYPSFLKTRILGPTGHLSNEQAAEAALEAVSGRTQWLWLAHLSAQNNRPVVARRAVESRLAAAKIQTVQVHVLDRYRPGPLFETPHHSRQWQLL